MSKQQTPLQAIRELCLNCSDDNPQEVRICPIKECGLHPFRFGRDRNQRSPSVSIGIAPSSHSVTITLTQNEASND